MLCPPLMNRLIETVHMRGHNICFGEEITKINMKLSSFNPFVAISELVLCVFFVFFILYFDKQSC